MAEQLADRRQRYPVHRGMAGEGMPQVVQPDVAKVRGGTDACPWLPLELDMTGAILVGKDPVVVAARQRREEIARGPHQV